MRSLSFLVFLLMFVTSVVRSEDSRPADLWYKSLCGTELVLNSSVNGNPIGYFDTQMGNLIIVMNGPLFPLISPEAITISTVGWKDDSLVLYFESEFMGEGSIIFYGEKDSAVLTEQNVNEALKLISTSEDKDKFRVGNDSKLVHYIGSNHCSHLDPGTSFAKAEYALAAGNQLCPACFGNASRNPDLKKELFLGRKLVAEIRSNYQVLNDEAQLMSVNELGQKILAQWPWSLQGYDYRFQVIKTDSPFALGCPGGEVYVSKDLWDLCETPLEKEAVLVHEIVHIELHHGVRTYKSAQTNSVVGGIVAGAAVGLAGKNAGAGVVVGGSMVYVLSEVSNRILYNGYPEKYMQEADAITRMYLKNLYGADSERTLFSILSKIDYLENCTNRKQPSTASSLKNQGNTKRLAFAREARAFLFTKPVEFKLSRKGKEAGIFSFSGATIFEWYDEDADNDMEENQFFSGRGPQYFTVEMRVFSTVAATGAVGLGTELKDIEIQIGEKWFDLDNKEDTVLEPNQSTRVLFEGFYSNRKDFISIPSVKITGLKISGFDAVLVVGSQGG